MHIRKMILALFVLVLGAGAAMGATITVSPGGDVHAAVASANAGDIVYVENGNYPFTSALNITQAITLEGQSEAGVIFEIDCGPGYGIHPSVGGVILKNFTMTRVAASGNMGFVIHASGTPNVQNGLTVSNVTINGNNSDNCRAGLDIHGYDNVDLDFVTSNDATYGNGIQLTGCVNVTVDNCSTSNNAWGSLAIYCSQYLVPTRACDNVDIDGDTCVFGEGNVFIEDQYGLTSTDVVVAGYEYLMWNDEFRSGAAGFTFIKDTLADAVAAATLGFVGFEDATSIMEIATGEYVVDASLGIGLTIQAAIDAAEAGDTINIGAGHFEEQLYIATENLTLTGAGTTQTYIDSPEDLALFYSTSADNYPIVFVDGVDAFTMTDLTVDGLGRGNSNYRFQGVGFWNAGGTLTDVNVDNVMDTPFSGNQHAIGVYAYNNTGGPYLITLTDVDVNDFQKGGVALSGEGLTVDLTRVTTPGQGPTDVTAQNGIQVSYGAGGSIVDCTVSDIEWTGDSWVASGILLYSANPVTVDGASIANVQSSVNNVDGDLILQNSTVTGATGDGAFTYVTGAKGDERRSLPSPITEDWRGTPKASVDVLYDNCSFSGAGTAGSWGPGIYLSGGDGNFIVTNCSATNFDYGLVVYENGGTVTGHAHENSFSGNLSIEAGIYTAAAYDISYNYWGGANPMDVVDFTAKAAPILSPWYLLPPGTVPMSWGTNAGIQAALDVANSGDTVHVLAGTYDENLVFNKSVFLLGPNEALSPNTDTRVAEAILMPSTDTAITGGADDIDVVIRGLTVDMGLGVNNDDRHVQVTGKANNNWTFEHNIFQNAPECINGNWYLSGCGDLEFTMLDNLYTGNDVANGIAIWCPNPLLNVQHNVFEDNEYTAFNINHAQGVISNNIFRDTRTIDFDDMDYDWYYFQSGILMAGDGYDLDITNNLFENVQYGVSMYANVDGPIDITGNTFDGVAIAGIRGSDSQAVPGDLDDVTVMNNNLLNYFGTGYMVWNARSDMAPLNAEYNWWGTADGAAIDLLASDYVDYDPWLGLCAGSMAPVTSGPVACDATVTLVFSLTTDAYTPDVFGFNAVVRASSEVSFSAVTDLEAFGTDTQFWTFDNLDGSYLISGTTIGDPSQPISGPGTTPLFSVTFTAQSDGVADITFDQFTLRDPDNNPIGATNTGATIEVDCTDPPAVTDIAVAPAPTSTQNGAEVSWTMADASDVDHYEIWRAVWHTGDDVTSAYPEYDDDNPLQPVPAADYAGLVASAEWTQVSNTVAGTATSFTDLDAPRGVYYYEVIPVDAVAYTGPLADANDRATNYYLGDFNGDGLVQGFDDVTIFGVAFGTQPGHPNWNNEVDIGPTDTNQGLGIPATDNWVNFEDLMIFSLNYGVFGAKSGTEISPVADLAWISYGNDRYGLRLVDASGLKGVHLRASLPEGADVTVLAGELLDAQSDPTFLRNVGLGLDVNVAVLGSGVGFTGQGDLFVVESSAPLTTEDLILDLRGADNSDVEVNLTSESGTLTPRVFGLYPNFPNPFNPMTKISFSLPEEQAVRLNIYGVDGKLVRTLVNEARGSGLHEVLWDGRSDGGQMQASGLYFYRIEAGPYSQVRKMTLMK